VSVLKSALHHVAIGSVLLLPALSSLSVQAAVAGCDGALPLEHVFDSGAAWELCVEVDERHGIELRNIHYRAPGDTLRSVLKQLHVAQIMMHYHDESDARPQLGNADDGRLLPMTAQQCNGDRLPSNSGDADQNEATLCARVGDNRVLAKFAQRPALHSERWVLRSALQRNSLVWSTSVALSEDGQITPAVRLSGRAREANSNVSTRYTTSPDDGNTQLVRATVLNTWRMVFNLDDGAFDKVQQFDFPLLEEFGNRRPMQLSNIDSERFGVVDRELFRAWRVLDTTGSGYYLDPSNSGFSYTGGKLNWTRFDVGFSRYKNCERYAFNNTTHDPEARSCGASLDDYINAESLTDAHPVMWYSQSHTFNPTREDWPVIRNFKQSFTLLPFDWTPASPFEVVE